MDNVNASAEAQARRLERVYEQLEVELHKPDVLGLPRQPASESEWSALQIAGHLAEMIPYWLHHCQALMAATGAPPSFGRTLDAPERLEGVARGAAGRPEQLLDVLRHEITGAAQAIRAMTPAERERPGVHLRRGLMTVAEVLEAFVVSHAEEHLTQIRQGRPA